MVTVNLKSLLIFSAFLRVFLIIYGEWQDTHMEVRYTDVDYLVFSDAAALVVAGKSPYQRSTYRYSPLIAILLVPNSFIHPSWGKFIFSASGNISPFSFWVLSSPSLTIFIWFMCIIFLGTDRYMKAVSFWWFENSIYIYSFEILLFPRTNQRRV